MKSIVKWLLGLTGRGSGETAADRMRVMVVNDRYQMPPAIVEQLKNEVLSVASRYFDIDIDSSDCVIKSQGNRRAYIAATIPLLKRGLENNDAGSPRKNNSKKNRRTKKESSQDLQFSAS